MARRHHGTGLAGIALGMVLAMGCAVDGSGDVPAGRSSIPEAVAESGADDGSALPEAAPVSDGLPGAPAGSDLPRPDHVDTQDATAVAKAVAVIMNTVDTDIDRTWHDASRRAAPFLAPDYLRDLLELPPRSGPGARWLEWADHRAYTIATAEEHREMGQPPDTALEAVRLCTVTVIPKGRDGWQGPPDVAILYIFLARTAAATPWSVVGASSD